MAHFLLSSLYYRASRIQKVVLNAHWERVVDILCLAEDSAGIQLGIPEKVYGTRKSDELAVLVDSWVVPAGEDLLEDAGRWDESKRTWSGCS